MNNFRHHLKVKFKKKIHGWDTLKRLRFKRDTFKRQYQCKKKNKQILALTTNIIMYKNAIVHPKLTKAVIKAL